jgi:hypothetical protein
MSTPARTIDPNDPRLTEEIQEIGLPHNPSPLQRRLYDLQLDDKLRRLCQCREFSKFVKCKNGHVHCVNSSRCELHFACKDCAEWEAHERVMKYAMLERFMPSKFFYVTIVSREAASGESIRKMENLISRVLRLSERVRRMIQFAVSPQRTTEVRIIYGHPSATSQKVLSLLKSAFPDSIIVVTAHLKNEFVRCMDKLTAPPDLPAHDPYRADLEFIFDGIRAFHILGFPRVELAVCKSKNADTDNSTEQASDTGEDHGHLTTKRFRKCRDCGMPLNFISNWFRTAALPRVETVKFVEWFHDILPKS